MLTGCGSCADFQFGLWILANSIGNINTANREESNLLADEESLPLLDSLLFGYTSIHLFLWQRFIIECLLRR